MLGLPHEEADQSFYREMSMKTMSISYWGSLIRNNLEICLVLDVSKDAERDIQFKWP